MQSFLHPTNGRDIGDAKHRTRLDGVLLETFHKGRGSVVRRLTDSNGRTLESILAARADGLDGPVATDAADRWFLLSPTRPPDPRRLTPRLRVVDLFAGCGGLSIGVREACRALHHDSEWIGVDTDAVAASVYRANLPNSDFHVFDVAQLFDGAVGSRRTARESSTRRMLGSIDVLIGGPPCQGHSAFNNRTRHSDKRNDLYLRMVRAAEVLEPEAVLIENVPGATRDRTGVVQRTMTALAAMGYTVASTIVDTADIGVAQRRKRLIVVASQGNIDLDGAIARHRTRPRSLRWAMGDLETAGGGGILDEAAASAPATRRRIDYLFEHRLYDLPDSERPACHASGGHSYRSIYGRLRWNEPAQTLTTGFYCMCMGRYVHPSKRRTLTAREAARIQFFPGWFDFGGAVKRGDLARLIGNAVPPKLGYVVGLELLR